MGWLAHTSILQHHLLLGTLKHILLHRVYAHKAIHANIRLLPCLVRAHHSLQVILRVPVTLDNTRQSLDTNIGNGPPA
jgi:hypothetical protein